MNLCVFTGWLPEGAGWGYRDSTHPVLMFSLVVKDARGDDQQLKLRIEDAEMGKRFEPMLTRGRVVIVQAEAMCVPVSRHEIVRKDVTAFRVLAIEVPNRAKADAPPAVSEALAKEAAA